MTMDPRTPTFLPALVRWYLREVEAEMPVRLHSRETAEDGDPEWHPGFRAWLTMHPGATDEDGNVRHPVRFWLWVWEGEGRERRVMASFLRQLALREGDWQAAVRAITPLTEDGEIVGKVFALAALQRFWTQTQSTPRRSVRPKSDSQVHAEQNV